MSKLTLLSAILRGSWLIDPRYAEGYYGKVIKLLQGEPVAFYSEDEIQQNIQKHKPQAATHSSSGISFYDNYDSAPEGSVAIIPYSGVVMKEDMCGVPGTASIRQRVQEAFNHPKVGAILIKMDSGGGAVDGTFELADTVSENKKPVIAFIDGLAASAGYAIICGSKEIYASHKTTEIGSIGTATTLYDSREALKQKGYEMHYINADTSPDKNQDYFDAIDKKYKPIKENILNPTNEVFLSTVRQNRTGKLTMKGNEPLTGKVYLSEKAIELGLIDGIKTIEETIARAQELSGTKIINQNTKMKVKILKVWNSLLTKLGLNVEEGKDHVEHEITSAQLEGINADLATLASKEVEITNLTTERDQAKTKVTDLEAKLSKSAEDITKLNGQVEELMTPAGRLKHAIQKTEDPASGSGKKKQVVTSELQDIYNFDFNTTKLEDNPSYAKQIVNAE